MDVQYRDSLCCHEYSLHYSSGYRLDVVVVDNVDIDRTDDYSVSINTPRRKYPIDPGHDAWAMVTEMITDDDDDDRCSGWWCGAYSWWMPSSSDREDWDPSWRRRMMILDQRAVAVADVDDNS